MSGANPWSVKGIDPKVREAARDAARRQGLTLGEYLNQALAAHEATRDTVAELEPPHMSQSPYASQMPQTASQPPRSRAGRLPLSRHSILAEDFDTDEEWLSPQPTPLPRLADPVVRLTQKLENIERRTQLAVTGLDRTVSTIDRSLLGLSQRVDDAEAGANDAADKVAEALEQFRIAHATLSGQLSEAETEAAESRRALENATLTVEDVRAQLEARVTSAEASARDAEASATILAEQIATRDERLSRRVAEAEADARSMVETAIAEARAAAEEAMAAAALEARAAGEEAKETATAITKNALSDIRAQQETLGQRLASTEHAARQAANIAITESRAARQELIERMERLENDAGARDGSGVALAELQAAQEILQRRIHECETGLRNVSADAVDEMRRMQAALTARIERVEGAEHGGLSDEVLERLRAAQDQLAQRIDKSEATAREATAGLRQSAGAAIADMRNAHLGLVARLKQVEDNGPAAVQDLSARVEDLAQRMSTPNALGATLGGAAGDRLEAALQQFSQRLDLSETQTAEIAGGVRTIEESMQRLGERLRQTEEAANSAIQRIENVAVGEGGARLDAAQLAEGVRAMLEDRLGAMAQQTTQMLETARSEIAEQVGAALDGLRADELEAAIAEVNRRISAAERRQAQTIEAISIEIRRMSETVDRRLRGVESRNEDVAGAAVHEEIARTAELLDHRLEEIERRDASAFDRMGIEIGRMSDRFDERLVSVESRSAQAIEQIGEQVARMAERFNQRQDQASRDVNDRIAGAEERMASRLSDAMQSLHQRVSEAEERDLEPPHQADMQQASTAYAPKTPMLEPQFAPPEPSQPLAPPLAPQPTPRLEHPHPMMHEDEHGPDLIVEDIEFDLPPHHQPQSPHLDAHADLHPMQTSRQPLPPVHAKPLTPQSRDYDADPFADDLDDLRDLPPPPADEDDLWSDASHDARAPAIGEDLPPLHAEPPRRDDYLAAARRAAQAQAAEMTKGGRTRKAKREDAEDGPVKGLRGPARIVLWGAAGTLAITLAGAALFLKAQPQRDAEPAAPQSPDVATTLPAATESVFDEPPLSDPMQVGGALPEAAPSAEAAIPLAAASQNQAQRAAATRAEGVIRGASARTVAAPVAAPRYASLDQAAASGDAVAQYDMALQRLQAGVTSEAIDLLRRSATQGLAMAQYRLAKLYERGEGVNADLAQARQWTERAAAGGNRRAMHDLGVFFARGEGAPLDEQAAFRWFRQAAELGVTDSQYNLGVLYQQGRGVQASASEAMFWFLVAARNGDSDAVGRAQTIEASLTQTQAEQARQRATAFRPRAASARANGEFGARAWPSAARTRG